MTKGPKRMDREAMMNGYARRRAVLEKGVDTGGRNIEFTRRTFVKLTLGTIAGLSSLGILAARTGGEPLIILEDPEGLVIGDATRCTGCRRCELACTEYNDGKAAPSMSRIKVWRNVNYGPQGVFSPQADHGLWGNGLMIQDICKQCAHPVPCANACPQDAITVSPGIGTRVVETERCVGCRMCQRACPWDMMSFDSDMGGATKCFLCQGEPKCVEACPADALRFVSWRDVTTQSPARTSPKAVIPPRKAAACLDCHRR